MRALLGALGSPQDGLPAVLVAGTNGKGSTAALLASMAEAAGYRVGLYTSPHLETAEERLRQNSEPIARADLVELLEEVVATAETEHLPMPTVFEAWTAAAFLAFHWQGVDLAVLEAGLGGARDATNTSRPLLSILTSVDRDHLDVLGPTLADVARDKAGVARRGRPMVVGDDLPAAAAAVLRQRIAEIGARPVFADEAVRDLASEPRDDGQVVRFATARRRYTLELSLNGEHQARNLALAVLAAEELEALGWTRLDAAAIARGATRCRWPGRLEWLPGDAVSETVSGRPILLDAAHNAAGAQVLERYLARYLEAHDEAFDLLFGVLGDKDAAAMLEILTPRFRRILLTAPPDRRSWDPAAFAAGFSGRPLDVEADLDAALARVLGPETTPLVVCGSLRLVGAVRARLRRTEAVA